MNEPAMTAPTSTAGRRTGSGRRQTAETSVEVELDVDGSGAADVSTGLPFFDHMVGQLGATAAST